MLNYLWAAMVLIGLVFGICNGRVEELGTGVLDSAGSAVMLCITMLGVLSMWMGLMQIAKASGLLMWLTEKLSPFLGFLFPRLPKESKAREYIATNIIANILGLGWAATPAGLMAMEELAKLQENPKEERSNAARDKKRKTGENVKECSRQGVASNEMCIFLILNVSSLQLIPINMIAYRRQYGSVNPAGIIVPALVATLISTILAVIFCKIMDKRGLKQNF